MNATLLKKLRKEAYNTYFVEKRRKNYAVVMEDVSVSKTMLNMHETLEAAKVECDRLRLSFMLNRVCSLKASLKKYRRVY